MRILVVEDDRHLALALSRILEDNGYEVDVVYDGCDGINYGSTDIYDVIILDVMLPQFDGFSVVQELRRNHIHTPVLLLTAKDEIKDKINGLDSGADDYMTKPFSPAELMAHLRALTRRQGEVIFETLTAGNTVLDLESYELKCNNESIRLSPKEFAIARMLLASPGTIVPKNSLIEEVWGSAAYTKDNNAEAYISFLRKKLAHIGSDGKIETVRSVGYRFVEDKS